ncbi:MAG: GGDEF domain-containing protein [Proteobacteria bacterium]|nr:GGDEF domain-containing protein [Pseudomonadota bacterium]
MKKIARPLLLPLILLGSSYFFILPYIGTAGGTFRKAFPYLPYIVFAIGIMLSFRFNVSRSFHILILMLLGYYGYTLFLQPARGDISSKIVFGALSILLPLNIAFFSVLKERGILTGHGIARIMFILLQVGFIFRLLTVQDALLYSNISRDFISLPALSIGPLSQAATGAALLSAIIVSLTMIAKRTPIENGFFGLLLALILACSFYSRENFFTLFVAMGGLILCLGIVQKSHDMAYRDELTGLPGRRALNERLLMLGRDYAIAMLDIDHFKRFNDTYGHDIGDQVLKMVASRIRLVTGGGKPYRYGGEEFTVIFPKKEVASILTHLESLRVDIEGYSVAIRGKDRPKKSEKGKIQRGSKKTGHRVSVTISIGVAERSDETGTPEAVIKSADEALYRAKKKGRNCVSK